jgi:hypothetical protein
VQSAAARCTVRAWAALGAAGEHAAKVLRDRLADAAKTIARAGKGLPDGADTDALPTAVASGNRELVGRWWDLQEAKVARDKITAAIAELIQLGIVAPNATSRLSSTRPSGTGSRPCPAGSKTRSPTRPWPGNSASRGWPSTTPAPRSSSATAPGR